MDEQLAQAMIEALRELRAATEGKGAGALPDRPLTRVEAAAYPYAVAGPMMYTMMALLMGRTGPLAPVSGAARTGGPGSRAGRALADGRLAVERHWWYLIDVDWCNNGPSRQP